MELDIFKIGFAIMPFIILFLYNKNRDYKSKVDKAELVVKNINDLWDKEYKEIVNEYGSASEFIRCHTEDFNVIRTNLIDFYSNFSNISRMYFVKTEALLELIETEGLTKKDIVNHIIRIRRDVGLKTEEVLMLMHDFITEEEEVHADNKLSENILNKIDEKYKNKELK